MSTSLPTMPSGRFPDFENLCAAAVGADLLAAEGALTNNATVIAEAKTALAQVNSLITAITDVDTLQVPASEFADLTLLANLAYEATQVLFYQNIPSGKLFLLNLILTLLFAESGICNPSI